MSTTKGIIEAAMAAQRTRERVVEQIRLATAFTESPAELAIRRAIETERIRDSAVFDTMRQIQEREREMRVLEAKWSELTTPMTGIVDHALDSIRSYRDAAERATALLRDYNGEALLHLHSDSIRAQLLVDHAGPALDSDLLLGVKAQDFSIMQDFNRRASESRMISGAFAGAADMRRLAEATGDLARASHLVGRIDDLTSSYADIASSRAAFETLPKWMREAPPITAYTGMRLVGVVTGVPSTTLVEDADEVVEACIDQSRGLIEDRLAAVGPGFADAYRGACRAVERRDSDWMRHAGVSMREVLDHLLAWLASDVALDCWCPAPTADEYGKDGWTRRAQLRYILRDARREGTERLVDEAINLILALFYPQNAAVHELVPPHCPEGMQFLLSQFQGHVATILDAAGF